MIRPIAFDVTHLASRLPADAPSGIDKVDQAYAAHFAERPCRSAVHYGFRSARVHDASTIAPLVQASLDRWSAVSANDDVAYARIYERLTGIGPTPGDPATACAAGPPSGLGGRRRNTRLSRRLHQIGWRLAPGREVLPHGSIYLNVAQHAFEYPSFFSWLEERPDVLAVFVVHDLLPLDWPEYFRPGYKARFLRRVETIQKYAGAVVTTSRAVAERIGRAYTDAGRNPVPIHVEPLPSTLPTIGVAPGAGRDASLSAVPYFVILGTIEPRKNHLLLLNVWRRLAEELASPPRLVVIGNRGWENEQVVDVLDRSALVRPHVIEYAGLGDHGLARIIENARALLIPSFAEGYGLPIVEALTLHTPVIAADIPVFREVSQGKALFKHPLDGPGWKQTILELSDTTSRLATEGRRLAEAFAPPTWDGYFSGVRAFLDQF